MTLVSSGFKLITFVIMLKAAHASSAEPVTKSKGNVRYRHVQHQHQANLNNLNTRILGFWSNFGVDITQTPSPAPSTSSANLSRSFEFGTTVCKDGHRCDNGSTCLENEKDEGTYYCACDIAGDDRTAFAGVHCEHKATEYCSDIYRKTSFCTNEASCVKKGIKENKHYGCECVDDDDLFKGDHCQFSANVPDDWPTLRLSSSSFTSSGGDFDKNSTSNKNGTDVIEVGTQICMEGYVMDLFCIERGTLFDNSAVVTLEEPYLHSHHCLLDVPLCFDSGFEILLDPISNNTSQTMYSRGVRLDETGNSMVIDVGRSHGKPGSCSSCTGEHAMDESGFRVVVVGTLTDMGSETVPPTMAVTMMEEASLSSGCPVNVTNIAEMRDEFLTPILESSDVGVTP